MGNKTTLTVELYLCTGLEKNENKRLDVLVEKMPAINIHLPVQLMYGVSYV